MIRSWRAFPASRVPLGKSLRHSQGPQRILFEQAQACGSHACVFADIRARLSAKEAQMYEDMLPHKSEPLDVRKEKIHKAHMWLQEHRAASFGPDACSYCLIHQQQCPANALSAMRRARRLGHASLGLHNNRDPVKGKKQVPH